MHRPEGGILRPPKPGIFFRASGLPGHIVRRPARPFPTKCSCWPVRPYNAQVWGRYFKASSAWHFHQQATTLVIPRPPRPGNSTCKRDPQPWVLQPLACQAIQSKDLEGFWQELVLEAIGRVCQGMHPEGLAGLCHQGAIAFEQKLPSHAQLQECGANWQPKSEDLWPQHNTKTWVAMRHDKNWENLASLNLRRPS